MTLPACELANEVTFVLIVSKLCNLRCRYCYEYPDLAKPQRMQHDQLTRVFDAIAQHVTAAPPLTIHFAWQGGEPLIHKPEYFRGALAAQARAFAGSRHRLVNELQTNLTLLDDERIAMLRECFDRVGVSHDVIGDLRVDVHGRSLAERTVANLDRLLDSDLTLGGISVLSRKNAPHVDAIYRFWQQRRLPFRLLPLHRGPFPDSDSIALTPEEITRALCRCVDLVMADDTPVNVMPIVEMMADTMRRRPGSLLPYDKQRREYVLIIDNDGSVGGMNELLDRRHAYGNLLEQPLDEILNGPAHRAAAARSTQQIAATCTQCHFFRSSCSGHPIGEGGIELAARRVAGQLQCVVTRATLTHIERRFQQAGLIDRTSRACAQER